MKLRCRVMVHNQIAINEVQHYKAREKGTDKSNADLNLCSGIGFIGHFGKSKWRSHNLEKMEGWADQMQSNARQSTICQCKYRNTTFVWNYLSLKLMYLAVF